MNFLVPIILNAKSKLGLKASDLRGLGDKERKLYNAILSGKVSNDSEASRLLFGRAPSHSGYRTFKRRLKEDIIRLIIQEHKPNNDRRYRAHMRVVRLYVAAKKLLYAGLQHPGIALMQQVLDLCTKYHIAEIGVVASAILAKHYASFDADIRKAEGIRQLNLKFRDMQTCEHEVEWLYAQMQSHSSYKKDSPDWLLGKYDEAFKKLDELKNADWSPKARMHAFLLRHNRHILRNDRLGVENVCIEAIDYFRSLSYDHLSGLLMFTNMLVNNYIEMGRANEAEKILRTSEGLFSQNIHSLIRNMELRSYIFAQSGNYEEALTIIRNAMSVKGINTLSGEVHERLRLCEYYLLIATGKEVRVYKFLNELSAYSGDKHAMNMALLIGELLGLIGQEKYDAILDKEDAIRTYIKRYASAETARSVAFLRMLISIPRMINEVPRAYKYAGHQLERLERLPVGVAKRYEGVEIVPYEDLWKTLVDRLNLRREIDDVQHNTVTDDIDNAMNKISPKSW